MSGFTNPPVIAGSCFCASMDFLRENERRMTTETLTSAPAFSYFDGMGLRDSEATFSSEPLARDYHRVVLNNSTAYTVLQEAAQSPTAGPGCWHVVLQRVTQMPYAECRIIR